MHILKKITYILLRSIFGNLKWSPFNEDHTIDVIKCSLKRVLKTATLNKEQGITMLLPTGDIVIITLQCSINVSYAAF